MEYCFLLLLAAAARLVSHGNDYSGNYGVDKLFLDIKNMSSCRFLVAIKFFSHFISEYRCKYAVRFKMKSKEEN